VPIINSGTEFIMIKMGVMGLKAVEITLTKLVLLLASVMWMFFYHE
jgi:hypothetical protein